MRFKISQDVQRADQIIGPLTLKQLIIIGSGGGLAYVVYLILAERFFWEVWLWPVGFISLITLGLAFLKIQGLPLLTFVVYFLQYTFLPKKRYWSKRDGQIYFSAFTQVTPKKAQKDKGIPEIKELTPEERRKKLEELSKVLNTQGKK